MTSVLESGLVKVNTIRNLREDETYGELVADEKEGVVELGGNLIFNGPPPYDIQWANNLFPQCMNPEVSTYLDPA